MKYLCDNEICRKHVIVRFVEDNLQYTSGVSCGCNIPKIDAQYFDINKQYNYCFCCQNAILKHSKHSNQ